MGIKKGIISAKVGITLKGLASIRNLLISRNWEIKDERIFEETKKSKEALQGFVEEIKRFLKEYYKKRRPYD